MLGLEGRCTISCNPGFPYWDLKTTTYELVNPCRHRIWDHESFKENGGKCVYILKPNMSMIRRGKQKGRQEGLAYSGPWGHEDSDITQ